MSTEKLYDAVIRKHNTNPYHFGKPEACTHQIEANNFICGDRFGICVEIENEIITQAYFHGFGCAVSKASASLLVQLIEGKSKEEALKMVKQFLRLLNQPSFNEKLYSEEFKSFLVVHEVPARYDCAALAWVEFEKFIQA